MFYSPYPSYIRIFMDVKNISRNYKLWQNCEYLVLFITGLAGSGKTYLAQYLALKYNVPLISLDSLKYYQDASDENKKLINEFISIYPEIASFIAVKWINKSNNNEIDKLYTKYTQIFTQYIIQKAFNNKKKYIVEGIHIFMRLPTNLTKNAPIVILGTSCIHSIFRKFRREYLSGKNEYRKNHLREIFHDLFVYEFQQLYQLNKYLFFTRNVYPTNKY